MLEDEYIEEQSGDSDGRQDDCEKKLKKVKKELSASERERKEYLGGWQRAQADFQNHIKQKDAEMREFRKFAADELVLKIFPILDNLSLAADSTPKNLKGDPWISGVVNVKRQLESVLREEGVEQINVERGDEFNPSLHEAIAEGESDVESGKIFEVVQKGYTLHGKVIRAARVKVAK